MPRFIKGEEAIRRVREISAGKIIPIGEYSGSAYRWLVQCSDCEHKWQPKATQLFRGQGCPKCVKVGFRPDEPAIVYYVQITDSSGAVFFKIGITKQGLKKRFRSDFQKVQILQTWNFEKGSDALKFEQNILREHAQYLYHSTTPLLHSGNNELFVADILRLTCTELEQPQSVKNEKEAEKRFQSLAALCGISFDISGKPRYPKYHSRGARHFLFRRSQS